MSLTFFLKNWHKMPIHYGESIFLRLKHTEFCTEIQNSGTICKYFLLLTL